MKCFRFTLEDTAAITAYLSQGTYPETLDKDGRRSFRRRAVSCFIEEGVLYMQTQNGIREVIADNDHDRITQVISRVHGIDHAGITVVSAAIASQYVGFSNKKVREAIAACDVCQRTQPLKRNEPITCIFAECPWERVQIDGIDLKRLAGCNDGYGWILNIIDVYSKFMLAIPLKTKSALEVMGAIRSVFCREGAPRYLQTDNGKEFINTPVRELCAEFGVIHVRGRPRHPQNQGQVERANQTLVRKIARALYGYEEKRWIDLLDSIVYAYNTRVHRATNRTPFSLFRPQRWQHSLIPESATSSGLVIENDSESSSAATLEDPLNVHNSSSQTDHVLEDDQPMVDVVENATQDIELEQHRQRYILRMKQGADVHYNRLAFYVGDKVLLKKDYDNNPTTKRGKMEGFYEEGSWVIERSLGNGLYRISQNEIEITVQKNRIKKYNEIGS